MRLQPLRYHVLALVVLATFVPAGVALEPNLPAVSGGELVWFTLDRAGPPPRTDVYLHVGPDAYAQRLVQTPTAPRHLAAWADRLWLVFPPPPDRPEAQREVFSVRAVPAPGAYGHFPDPADHLRVEPGLPADGDIEAMVATPDGPVAVWRASGVASLRGLAAGGWREIALPRELRETARVHLAVGGSDGTVLHALGGAAGAGTSSLARRAGDEPWRTEVLDVPPHAIVTLVRVGPQVALVTSDPGRDEFELSYLRPDGRETFARVPHPTHPWAIVGVPDAVLLLERMDDGERTAVRRIDSIRGAVGPSEVLGRRPLPVFDLLRIPLLFLLAIIALVTVLVVRPAERGVVTVPAVQIASLSRRGLALLVDLLPGAAVAMAVLGTKPSALFDLPFVRPEAEASLPYLLMVAILILHAGSCDLAGWPSLGRRLLGLQVVGVEGEVLSAARRRVRLAIKVLSLLVPPLAVLVLLSPFRQALHDVAARSIVITGPIPSESA